MGVGALAHNGIVDRMHVAERQNEFSAGKLGIGMAQGRGHTALDDIFRPSAAEFLRIDARVRVREKLLKGGQHRAVKGGGVGLCRDRFSAGFITNTSWLDLAGGIEARTGLRMMPTSPRSPLSFRTAGFPQYGWKAGISGGAFPAGEWLKPAPGIHQPTAGLRPPFVQLVGYLDNPALRRVEDSILHRLVD